MIIIIIIIITWSETIWQTDHYKDIDYCTVQCDFVCFGRYHFHYRIILFYSIEVDSNVLRNTDKCLRNNTASHSQSTVTFRKKFFSARSVAFIVRLFDIFILFFFSELGTQLQGKTNFANLNLFYILRYWVFSENKRK